MRFSNHILVSVCNNNLIKIRINNPNKNMQDDSSCFESIALLLKAKNKYCKIELDYDLIDFNPSINSNYMRFLYRLNRFYNAFDWFEISELGLDEIRRFNKFINDKNLFINTPEQPATYNRNKGYEHHIENLFANQKQNYLFKLVNEITGDDMKCVYNQLPNGLFYDKVSSSTRIFPTGYFDLWGINNKNEFCVFELKEPKNKKMGIITELFFYAIYLNDFYFNSNFNNIYSQHRGFPEIIKLQHPKIIAYFLTNGLHTEIIKYKDDILLMLNSIDPNIDFCFIDYDEGEL